MSCEVEARLEAVQHERQAGLELVRVAVAADHDLLGDQFYERCGYVVYGREVDFPPGHTNFWMRKDL